MFAGAQIVTTKLVRPKHETDIQNEDKTSKDMSLLIPQSKTAMIIENSTEKIERKILAQERKQERFIEQQKLAQRMENLMEKVLRETPLSKKDEDDLRIKIKTIVNKVNKESDSVKQSHSLKSDNQGAFLFWYDKKF